MKYHRLLTTTNKDNPITLKACLPAKELVRIEATARRLFDGASGSHDLDHTLRVYRLGIRIGKLENADLDVVRVAALLHDIGRAQQDTSNGQVCHAGQGAIMSRDIIRELPLTGEQKENIVHSIRTHRFRGNHPPETLEARVLFDADKLDAIGAVGVARAYLFAGEIGARLHSPEVKAEDSIPYSENDTGYREYRLKLQMIKNRMLTETGRKLAGERHRFMEAFFERFLTEYEGKG
jgi:uncharacterized protein